MLDICKSLFAYLNTQNIKYCHWKSNSHLDKGLSGRTDLDLLVHEENKYDFEMALKKYSIIKILSPPPKQYPSIEDYLGFDYVSGRFIHLHIHYNLVLGQKYIKNHHLPIEEFIFSNLCLRNNIYIPSPEIELVLLTIRAHMKVDTISLLKHFIKGILGTYYIAFPADIEREFEELIAKSDLNSIRRILSEINLPIQKSIFFDFIDRFISKKLSWINLLNSKIKIMYALKNYRRNKGIRFLFKYIMITISNWSVFNRFFHKTRKKSIPGEGYVFSLVGADGSGKSSLIEDLEKWLGWKLHLRRYYYGIPKAKYIKLLDFLIRCFHRIKITFISNLLECFLWLHIAKKRYSIFLATKANAYDGQIVLTDRFPLRAFHNMEEPMDGPRLQNKDSTLYSHFDKKEKSYYEKIIYPDKIFILKVDIEELRRRKTDLDYETHKIKADSVNLIVPKEHYQIINGNLPYKKVLLEIQRAIWAVISKQTL